MLAIFKNKEEKKKTKSNKTQPQVTPKPQNNSPLLNAVFSWTSKITLLASRSHCKQAESRDKHTTREPERKGKVNHTVQFHPRANTYMLMLYINLEICQLDCLTCLQTELHGT